MRRQGAALLRFRWQWAGMPRFLRLLQKAFTEWKRDSALRLGAALSFYTVLSLPPLLVVVIAITGLAFGREAAQARLVAELHGLLGGNGARMFEEMLAYASRPREGFLASAVGLVLLIVGASGVFGQLQDALNAIWQVPPKEHAGIMQLLRHRFLSLNVVLGSGFLLLVSLVVSAGLASLAASWRVWWKGFEVLVHGLDLAVSFVVITVLFAMIFKFLPDTRVRWRHVWIGAAMTSFLFTLGKFAIGLYLGKSKIGSAYGAAGSLVLMMLWVYYSAQIFFFGAEFTKVHSVTRGSREKRDPTGRAIR